MSRRFLLGFTFLLQLSACAPEAGDREHASAVAPPQTWTGTVSMLAVEGRPPVTGLTLTGDRPAKYVLFFDAATQVAGIERDAGSILWQLGKRYQVQGDEVTDEKELGAARGLGFDGIIMARHVQLLD